ncbi:MAG TPA: diheme cytochrome c [Steroidobacter sp.]|nr:diheme cytochrome c [Steroidobacter sp.]
MSRLRDSRACLFGSVLLIAAWSSAASAAEPAVLADQQTWREECGGCHVSYPARLLPQASWDEIMRTLGDHFGADASLDESTAASVRRYLASVARTPKQAGRGPPALRITETRWFIHEHDELSPAKWRSPKVRSASNCVACHRDAEAGRFGEHSLKLSK